MSLERHIVSSSPVAFRLRWDVFLSFRGTDTRDSFTKHLYDRLHSENIRVFRDDDGMERGDDVAPSLLEAIDDSAASIVILSPNYANSHWCLAELAKICDNGRLILPVFYRVDPSDVRKQTGPFAEGFKSHEGRFQEEEVLRWREAMKKVGNISGWAFYNSDESHLIQQLVERVLKELKNTPVRVAEFTVGLDDRTVEIMQLLELQSNGVRVFGLYGMGGVGKTTLAKSLFNNLVGHFEFRCFISNVREASSKTDGLISLQNRVISDLSPGTVVPINDVNVGISSIKRVVNENRVLLILDDVDDVKHLDSLIGKREWFYEGSRIIVTTRNRQVLPENHVNVFYEVKELDSSQALELFSYHAQRKKEPAKNFLNLSKQIVSLTGGLPLALEVFGSFLFDKRTVEEWDAALEKLKQIRPGHLQDVLKISFNGLDEQEQCIFLDIACLFVQMRMKRDYLIDILRGCGPRGFRGEIAITVLIAKCLIKFTEDDTLWMHDQIKDMGRQIVVNESLIDPGKRSRLWDRYEILSVLNGEKGTRCIQGMVLDFEKERHTNDKGEAISGKSLEWSFSFGNVLAYINACHKKYLHRQVEKGKGVILNTKSFKSMVNLRLLQINNLRLEGKFELVPKELKWLQWQGCPLKCMPSDFCPQDLAILDLSNSKIETLWGGKGYKVPENLMVMNLSSCFNLAVVPDLSGCQRLEKIVLENCINLISIHESIGNLITLRELNLTRCLNLIELPSGISELRRLESLFLSDCSKLKALPKNIGSMRSLRILLADNTAVAELPESIFRLTKLEHLVLDGCQSLRRLPNCVGKLCSLQNLSLNHSALEELPDAIGSLAKLEKLSVMGCKSLTEVPDSISNLVSLTQLLVNGSVIRELPSSIGSLPYLREIAVGNCKFLSKLPDSIENLVCLVELQLDGTAITNLPDQIGALKMLRKLDMRNCKHIKSLPESIGHLAALTTLNIFEANISELPESIGLLENLVLLRLNKCRTLRQLPVSVGNLKSLYHLWMEETALTELPESFGMLTSLRTLKMAKRPDLTPIENSLLAKAVVPISQESLSSFVLPCSFCNLTLLSDLDARAWRISGKIPDDFEKLSSLETLNLSQNNFDSLPSSLKGLSILKRLSLRNCSKLTSLPPLPSSLVDLNVDNCSELESIHDLSNLGSLQELNLTNCTKVVDIPGLECLKSLRRLYLSDCIACSSAVSKRLSKVALRNLTNLCMPGTRLPAWFSGQTVSFSKRKNCELKGAIIGVVLSINHDIPSDMRGHLPGVVDVQVEVRKLGKTLYTTVPKLTGVPRTNEGHIHLCRYPDYHVLVSFLKDGGTLNVTKRNPPVDKGLELIDRGVHLIFEGDDDYEGDEESVDKSLQSVSEKLANFFRFSEGDEPIVLLSEDEGQNQSRMLGREERKSSCVRRYSICLFVINVLFLLLSWLWLKQEDCSLQTWEKPT